MSVHNYGERLTDWAESSLTMFGLNDDLSFEVLLALAPDGNGGIAFIAQLVLGMPSPILGSTITHIVHLPVFGATRDLVEQAVLAGLEQMREERSRQLSAPRVNGS